MFEEVFLGEEVYECVEGVFGYVAYEVCDGFIVVGVPTDVGAVHDEAGAVEGFVGAGACEGWDVVELVVGVLGLHVEGEYEECVSIVVDYKAGGVDGGVEVVEGERFDVVVALFDVAVDLGYDLVPVVGAEGVDVVWV
jgi:hypothetical protein